MKYKSEEYNEARFLNTLEDLDNGTIEPAQALSRFMTLLKDFLNILNAPYNIHNAAQAAFIISAFLCPTDPLNAEIKRRTLEGTPPQLINSPAEQYAIQRGCAVILVDIIGSRNKDLPQASAQRLLDYIESTGALPRPEDIIE